jgi:methionine-rich copper-binding protein CopC
LKAFRFSAALFITIIFSFLIAPKSFAHAELVSASPGQNEILTTWPEIVSLTFNEVLLDATGQQINFLTVTDATGMQIDNQDSTLSGNLVTVSLPAEMPFGSYFVNYRVVSADGHVIEDSYEIIFDSGETDLPTDAVTQAGESAEIAPISADIESNSSPWSAVIVLVSIISFGVLIFQLRKNRIR